LKFIKFLCFDIYLVSEWKIPISQSICHSDGDITSGEAIAKFPPRDDRTDIGIFRVSTGLWAIRGDTRNYFGGTSNQPVPADYNGDSSDDIGIFRDTSGLWAIRGLIRALLWHHWGCPGD